MLYNSSVNEIVENAIETLIYVCQTLDQRQQLAAIAVLKQTVSLLQNTAGSSSVAGFAHNKVPFLILVYITDRKTANFK